jgi:hypothetical protein
MSAWAKCQTQRLTNLDHISYNISALRLLLRSELNCRFSEVRGHRVERRDYLLNLVLRVFTSGCSLVCKRNWVERSARRYSKSGNSLRSCAQEFISVWKLWKRERTSVGAVRARIPAPWCVGRAEESRAKDTRAVTRARIRWKDSMAIERV